MKFIYWFSRVFAILFILFIAMFSLDIFDGKYNFWQTIIGLFMHNILTFFMIIALLIAWKREMLGGIIFIAIGIAASIFFHNIFLFLPFLAIGVLFICQYFFRKKHLSCSIGKN